MDVLSLAATQSEQSQIPPNQHSDHPDRPPYGHNHTHPHTHTVSHSYARTHSHSHSHSYSHTRSYPYTPSQPQSHPQSHPHRESHQRSASLQHLNSSSADTSMEPMSPTSGPHAFMAPGPASASPAASSSAPNSHPGSVSPRQPAPAPAPQQAVPKNVSFELCFNNSPMHRARLPMRVQIYPHDTTDSIVTTVKNFYGLYSAPNLSRGVSFQDDGGNTLIARYENFHNNMVVYVRVIDEIQNDLAQAPGAFGSNAAAESPVRAQAYYGSEGYQMQQPQRQQEQREEYDIPGPDSRADGKRSTSPNSGRGRRSGSSGTNKKGRSRSSKTRTGADDGASGYSSGDGSTTSVKKEPIGNTNISLENIVEGNRRKRAKFESSELPLFAPPQMPATTSNPSVSPARRLDYHHRPSLPIVPSGQNPFTNPQSLQSPQSYNNGYAHPSTYATPADRRSRHGVGFSAGAGAGGSVIPTPDPTVHSCMSEEDKDVALQLMRLGDMSNISHGRTSASTLDDTFSGRADAASSTGATSDVDSEGDGEDEKPAPQKQKLDSSGASRKIFQTTETHFTAPLSASTSARTSAAPSAKVESDTMEFDNAYIVAAAATAAAARAAAAAASSVAAPPAHPAPTATNHVVAHTKPSKISATKHKAVKPRAQSISKAPKASKPKTGRPAGGAKTKKAAAAPTTTADAPRDSSTVAPPAGTSADGLAHVPGEDGVPDLSTKPRCQRCRKSKKGCDRQRPCGRCRDAGLGADQCISEDEGNGRKGRYGRHMGVPIKADEAGSQQATLLPAAPIQATHIGASSGPAAAAFSTMPPPVSTTAIPPPPIPMSSQSNKKRKR